MLKIDKASAPSRRCDHGHEAGGASDGGVAQWRIKLLDRYFSFFLGPYTLRGRLFDTPKMNGTKIHPEVSIKKANCIQIKTMIQGIGLAVVGAMMFVSIPQAHGEVWNCHFEGRGSQNHRVEIDTKLEIRVESQNKKDRNKVRLLFSEDTNKTTVSEGYLQRMRYRELKYLKADEPPLKNDWDGAIYIPAFNYENQAKPEILKGYFFSIDFPAVFSLVRNASTPDRAKAILNLPFVEVPLEGTCRSSQEW